MSSEFIVIVGFIIGGAILFFDCNRWDLRDQEYRWLPFAWRRSMRFSLVTFFALALAWSIPPPVEILSLLVTLAVFFVMMNIFLSVFLMVQKKRDLQESERRDRALELLRKSK